MKKERREVRRHLWLWDTTGVIVATVTERSKKAKNINKADKVGKFNHLDFLWRGDRISGRRQFRRQGQSLLVAERIVII